MAVGLRMIGGGHVKGGVGEGGEGGPKGGGETGVPVGDDVGRPPMEAEDVVKVELGDTLAGNGLSGGDDVDKLSEAVGKGDECVEATRGEREAGDEVEGDGFPSLVGDGKGVKEAMRMVGGSELASLARGAVGDVGADGVV